MGVTEQSDTPKIDLNDQTLKKDEKVTPKAAPVIEIIIDDDEEDEDQSLVCKKCSKDFWYKSELHEHMKKDHNIADPLQHDKEEMMRKIRAEQEERQRKLALIRQEQQRRFRLSEKEKKLKREDDMKKLRAIHAEKVRKQMERSNMEDLVHWNGGDV